MFRRLGAAVVFLCLAAPASAQILFAMDGTGGFSTNLFNFDSYTSDSHVTMTRQTGICQDGTDAIRYVQVSDVSHSQYSFGHSKAVTDTVAQGDTRYYRLRLRYNGATDFSGNSGPWYTKWVIIGTDSTMPTTPGGRVIFHTGVGGVDNTTPNAWASKNVDISPPNRVALSITNGWNNIQARFRSSTTASAADGRVDLYVGSANTSEAGPSDSETGVVLNLTGSNTWTNPSIGAGGFAQTTITSSGNVSIDVCNVTYATTFDTAWNTPGGGGGSPKYRFRFRSSVDDLTLFTAVSLAGVFVVTRRSRVRGRQ